MTTWIDSTTISGILLYDANRIYDDPGYSYDGYSVAVDTIYAPQSTNTAEYAPTSATTTNYAPQGLQTTEYTPTSTITTNWS